MPAISKGLITGSQKHHYHETNQLIPKQPIFLRIILYMYISPRTLPRPQQAQIPNHVLPRTVKLTPAYPKQQRPSGHHSTPRLQYGLQ
jgi:hypothetical protein